MARVLKGSQIYLHTPRSSANGMNHTCLMRSVYPYCPPYGTFMSLLPIIGDEALCCPAVRQAVRCLLTHISCDAISLYLVEGLQ